MHCVFSTPTLVTCVTSLNTHSAFISRDVSPLGCSGSVIGDHSDHGRSNEPMNPYHDPSDPDPDHPKGTHP